ncbi:tetratricopeptide repeat-containing protein [Sphingomonas sp. KR3-1]|uniref:tetratricopeptide repeat-containing protein n=1 Tax=Sphingomonas sp. KR3-1 TaxID=3156611 RepID=UPI0032B46B08
MTIASLTRISALARLGAIDRAWQLFETEGHAARQDDPAALALKGRLLKDRAWHAQGSERLALLAQAEQAYAAADALAPAPYLLINVAALATLAGAPDRGAAIAGDVLARLAHDVAETPYYIAATKAEALLLRGDRDGAEQALAHAARLLPAGWEERAGTLRQFARILDTTGQDSGWLGRFRAPASLHYAGHLGIAPPGADSLRAEIARVIAERRVGFAFGALAAGADLLAAEAALAAGAALHIVLPCPPDAFARQSVAPYGAEWMPRYQACLAAAASLRIVANTARCFDPLPTALAAEVAMGAALLHADRLAADALQLVVIDEGPAPFGSGAGTARDAAVWPRRPDTDQVVLRWPRDAAVPPSAGKVETPEHRALMALVLVAPGCEITSDDALDDWIDQVRARLDPGPAQHVQAHGNALLLGFGDIAEAARFALAVAERTSGQRPTRVAGTYGLVRDVAGALAGSAVATAEAVAAICPPWTATVDDVFADALTLHAGQISSIPLGDYGGASGPSLPLFALVTGSR